MSRYARQIIVPSFGAQGQREVEASRVLVIGAGGLASPVLQYLVGAGVGGIRLVDADRVALGNLHRQTIFTEKDIGRAKVDCAAKTLRAFNSDVKIEAIKARFDPANATDLFQDIQLVMDCADSFAASYIASDLCLKLGVPMISASVLGTQGYVGGFCGCAPGLRAVFPDLPQRLGVCDADGVLGPVVGVIGSLQAQMALAVLSGQNKPLGQLVTFDADNYRFGGFRFDDVPNPPSEPSFIAANAVLEDDFVIDLRSAQEDGPGLSCAIRASVDDISRKNVHPAHAPRVVLACKTGLRAWTASRRLAQYWQGDIKLLALGETHD